MKSLMIDIDDVICGQGFIKLLNDFLNTDYKEEDTPTYYLQDLVPENRKEEFADYVVTENFYDYVDIYDNCIEVIEKLNYKYDVYICSSAYYRERPNYAADLIKYKFQFLTKNFPFLDSSKFIFMTDKKMLDCDIKIDDKIDNLENAEIKILYSAYHNRNIEDSYLCKNNVKRVDNWKEIESLLLDS